jgi:predicted permease
MAARSLITLSNGLIASVSTFAALTLAWWASHALVSIAGRDEPVSLDVGPNARVLGFALATSFISVVIFGLVPAIRSARVDLATSMRMGARNLTGGRRIGGALIAGQVALCLVLLAGALTLARGLRAVLATDVGFDRDHLVVARLDIEARGLSGARLANTVHALRERITALPGVRAVTYDENGLFEGTDWSNTLDIPGVSPLASDDSVAATDAVGAGYAAAIGARVIAGRDLTPQDEGPNARAALVDEAFAQFYFPGQNAIGRIVRSGPTTELRIVGVIANVRSRSLEAPTGHYTRRLYYPYLHGDDTTGLGQPGDLRMLVRTSGNPNELAIALRRLIAEAEPSLPIIRVSSLGSLIGRSVYEEVLAMRIASAISILAVVLAAIGLFGVVSYSIARRTSEIGIRIALGASGVDVGRMVLREAMRPVAVGIVCGIPLLFAATRMMRERLFVAHTSSVGAGVLAAAMLLACAAIAALAPANRASRITPLDALREE